jgi:hypothetical protein
MTHDDMMDCMARITEPDMFASFPSGGMGPDGLPVWVNDKNEDSYDFDTYAYITRRA